MINNSSIKIRFIASFLSNAARGCIVFATNLILARALAPEGYGNLTFLLNSFAALLILLDMGSSNAFFTFISQRNKNWQFYSLYLGWISLQFFMVLAAVLILIPNSIIENIWLSLPRHLIILSFMASFFQQRLWTTVCQIGEAIRQTVKVQLMTFLISLIYLLIILFLPKVSLTLVLLSMTAVYGMGSLLTPFLLRFIPNEDPPEIITYRQIIRDFANYSYPLAIVSFVNFGYSFLDTWLIQKFAGAQQQAFFQIGRQATQVSLLATNSILRVFWKEIAESVAVDNRERTRSLYKKTTKMLFAISAIISAFLIPWSKEIIIVLLGPKYLSGYLIVAIMFFYPIHQTLGQINGVMFLATEKTKPFSIVNFISMLLSIPIAYLLLAPSTGMLINGFHVGAIGIVIRLVLLNILSVNVLSWMLAKQYNWGSGFFEQAYTLAITLFIGFFVKYCCSLFGFSGANTATSHIIFVMFSAGVIYCTLVSLVVFAYPTFIGLTHAEIRSYLTYFCRQKRDGLTEETR